jgi:hypothetical protein
MANTKRGVDVVRDCHRELERKASHRIMDDRISPNLA